MKTPTYVYLNGLGAWKSKVIHTNSSKTTVYVLSEHRQGTFPTRRCKPIPTRHCHSPACTGNYQHQTTNV